MILVDDKYSISYPIAILFDWDNTLVDSWPAIYQAMHHTFIKYGRKPWTLDEVKTNVHRSVRDALPFLFPDNWEEVAKVYRQHYKDFSTNLAVLPNVEDTLDLTKTKQIYTALISNKRTDMLVSEVERFNFTQYFKKVIGSGDLPKDKPSPIMVHVALEDSGISSGNHVWFIGDSVTDMETAYNSGCTPVFFGEDDYKSDRYLHCRPKIYFQTHKQLASYLKGL